MVMAWRGMATRGSAAKTIYLFGKGTGKVYCEHSRESPELSFWCAIYSVQHSKESSSSQYHRY